MRDRVVIIDILTKKFKSISYKQYDSNNELNIVVYEGKTLADISNYVASVYFELPSGKRYEVEGTIENNTVKVMLSSSILEEYGQVDVECQLFNLDEVVTTFTFYLDVEKSINKAGALDPNTQHKHLNLDVLNQITQEMVDSNFAVQPNFTFAINMIASTEQPSVTTTGVYPNLVITFNIPQGTTSSGGDEPIVAEKAIYYGRLSIAEVGGKVVQYDAITDEMIKNGTNITKMTPQTLGKTSLGKESTTAEGDYAIIVVPDNEGYVVTQDNGFGGKVIFNKQIAGANGEVKLTIDGNQYAIYGEIFLSPVETFIYIDKN